MNVSVLVLPTTDCVIALVMFLPSRVHENITLFTDDVHVKVTDTVLFASFTLLLRKLVISVC